MALGDFLETLTRAINERTMAKEFGQDFRERERKLQLAERTAGSADLLRRAQLKASTRAWDAKLRAAQQLHPDLDPESALAVMEGEGYQLDRDFKLAQRDLAKAQATKALREPQQKFQRPLKYETDKGVFLRDLDTGENEFLGNRPPSQAAQPAPQIVVTDAGIFRVPRRDGEATPVTAAGTGGQTLQPRPRTEELSAAGLFSDMGAAVSNLQRMMPNIRESIGATSLAGPRAKVGEYLGTDRELVAARNEAARLFDLVYTKSGKQINEREQAILKQYLPDINQDPDVFMDNLDRFVETLQNIAGARGLQQEIPELFQLKRSTDFEGRVQGGGSSAPAGPETKQVGGVTYQKVGGRWRVVR